MEDAGIHLSVLTKSDGDAPLELRHDSTSGPALAIFTSASAQ